MTRLLHISASPRGDASESLGNAREFLDAFAATHPDPEIDEYDLWDGTLPAFGPAAAAAKMAVFAGEQPTGAGADAWRAAEATFRRFAAADPVSSHCSCRSTVARSVISLPSFAIFSSFVIAFPAS